MLDWMILQLTGPFFTCLHSNSRFLPRAIQNPCLKISRVFYPTRVHYFRPSWTKDLHLNELLVITMMQQKSRKLCNKCVHYETKRLCLITMLTMYQDEMSLRMVVWVRGWWWWYISLQLKKWTKYFMCYYL